MPACCRATVSGGNTAPQRIRFMAKANSTEYVYVVKNQYWYKSSGLDTAQTNFITAVDNNQPPQQPYVFFPAGTIEVKAAWRPLAPADNPAHFHTATVLFYETGPCYFEAQWALIALHIIQKTPTAPAFIFATFEQAENILTATGGNVDDANNAVINPDHTGADLHGFTDRPASVNRRLDLLHPAAAAILSRDERQ
jgi:hypothetical protein